MMTPRIPRASGKDVIAALIRAGFRLVHVRGSHHYLEPSGGGLLVTVPVHGNKTLKPKTLKSILNQAGLTIEELLEML
ncbi:type II toxin-antitoxin system HicA family toxin [Desulfoscipio gibsoniae]|uniref:Putative periplasmic or secreted lipoprotein n=1 Tax=Desulfoscipio gibsoniae DSM 7213 TaxID=767817 RepID=R4KTP3_9FIRM|nr:type II toxin-antitoxin system HicA family toxin [Desulfoscipio gibsoniae]AGL02976.1 putative periplasmic or secreted lipoprotein [Desulfoscipio gibsoniae DSM 7213]